MPRIDSDDPDRGFGWLFAGMPLIIFAGVLASFVFHKPQSVPSLRSVAGCYTTDRAPAINLAGHTLSVGQPGFKPVHFDIEWMKSTLVITTDVGMELNRTANGSAKFGLSRYGNYPFYPAHLVDGKIFPVLAIEDSQFLATEDDHQSAHIYKITEPAACAGFS